MANTASARKRVRQTLKRTERNRARKSRMRTFVKKVEAAITGGDPEAATEALRVAQPEMQRAATKGVVHRNTVSRKLSRLSARIKAMQIGLVSAAFSQVDFPITSAFVPSRSRASRALLWPVLPTRHTHCCRTPF